MKLIFTNVCLSKTINDIIDGVYKGTIIDAKVTIEHVKENKKRLMR